MRTQTSTRRVPRLLLCALVGASTFSQVGTAAVPAPKPTMFISVTGLDNPTCTRATPCLRFAHVHAIAKPGTIVQVGAGSYSDQTIEPKPEEAGKRIVFQRAPGARVEIAGLTVRGSHVEFRNMAIKSWSSKPTASDLRFENIKNGGFWIEGSMNVAIIRGSVGPGVDYHPIIGPADRQPPRNIVIDRVFFHDWTRSNSDVHTECLQVGAADGLVIRRSRFWNCAVMSLFLSYWGGGPHPRNITIENNYFDGGRDGGFYSVRFADHAPAFENVLVRNNSALAPFSIDTKPALQNFRVIANVAPLPAWGCNGGVIYRYNVWNGARCGPTDATADPLFRDPARLDLRLKNGARAINRGDPTSFPAVDIDGKKRPFGRRPDAGANERR